MTKDDLKVGHFYRAKHPRKVSNVLLRPAQYNDRVILWISHDRLFVQFDSSALPLGRRYPQVPVDQFLSWAGRDVTEDYRSKGIIAGRKWMEWQE